MSASAARDERDEERSWLAWRKASAERRLALVKKARVRLGFRLMKAKIGTGTIPTHTSRISKAIMRLA